MLSSFYDTLDTLLAIQKAVEAAHSSDYFGMSTTSSGSFPAINMFQKGDDTILTAEIPGVKKEDIQLEVKGNLLKISGEKKTAYPEKASIHRVERKNIRFNRSIRLPMQVDLDKVKADYSNGILSLTLPRAESDKPKQIAIK